MNSSPRNLWFDITCPIASNLHLCDQACDCNDQFILQCAHEGSTITAATTTTTTAEQDSRPSAWWALNYYAPSGNSPTFVEFPVKALWPLISHGAA
jgi:hypothetical protein